MSSYGTLVRPGEDLEITARPSRPAHLVKIAYDREKFAVRRSFLRAWRSSIDVAFAIGVDSADLSSPGGHGPMTIEPGTRVMRSEDIHLRVSYVGPDPDGEVFCAGILLVCPDPDDPRRPESPGACRVCALEEVSRRANQAQRSSLIGMRWLANCWSLESGKPLPYVLTADEVGEGRRLEQAREDAHRACRAKRVAEDIKVKVDPEFYPWE